MHKILFLGNFWRAAANVKILHPISAVATFACLCLNDIYPFQYENVYQHMKHTQYSMYTFNKKEIVTWFQFGNINDYNTIYCFATPNTLKL